MDSYPERNEGVLLELRDIFLKVFLMRGLSILLLALGSMGVRLADVLEKLRSERLDHSTTYRLASC